MDKPRISLHSIAVSMKKKKHGSFPQARMVVDCCSPGSCPCFDILELFINSGGATRCRSAGGGQLCGIGYLVQYREHGKPPSHASQETGGE
ncbi:hypothetical protein COCON_G00029940 [Conger conger]|uniref:Uncharacterized protein n=1 Tax=Conger conger TaxID=82655 RepID=A0A9Q1I678_CONCO|nr:hypothetical protein COCON_G00029940 [Conger conger]